MIINPLVGVQLAGMAISGLSNFFGQKAANKQAKENVYTVMRNAGINLDLLNMQAQQTKEQFNLEAFERQRQTLRNRAKIMAAAGEAGVAGSSTMRLLNQQLFDEGYDISIQQANFENQLENVNLRAMQTVSNAQNKAQQYGASIKNPWAATGLLGAIPIAGYLASKS